MNYDSTILILTGSMRKTCEAAVKLIPTPPAFSDSRNTVGDSWLFSENLFIASKRLLCDIVPSRRVKEISFSLLK